MGSSSLIEAAWGDSDPLEALARQRAVLRRLEDVAEVYLSRGEYDDAVGTVGAAAHIGMLNHPGVLASPRLEAVLAEISERHLPRHPARTGRASTAHLSGKERVLIVVTETYLSGGHTRVLWRWIGRDPGRTYSLVTTAQRGQMPDGVRAAVAASGGEIVDIPPAAPPLQRAAELSAHAADADLIVLLDHPYDPIPALAFAGLHPRPPIVMFDHGDHLFWIGRDVVDALMSIRWQGVELAARRGFPDSRVVATTFPVSGPDGHGRDAGKPLDPLVRSHARAQVFDALGWPADTVLLVTVGTHHKWEGPPGHGLLDLIEPVLAAAPDACLVAAGAEDRGRWTEMRLSTSGRVVAAGVLPTGVGQLLTAADIFLDSRPIGGTAAPAEAAAHGLPVLTGAATELETSVLVAADSYGATCVVGNDAYRDELAQLIADRELRRGRGEQARRLVAAADDAWEEGLEQAYALARSRGPIAQSELGPIPETDGRDVLIDWCYKYPGRTVAGPESVAALRELIAATPLLRQLYGPLEHTTFQQLARFSAVFATPPAEAGALRAAVEKFRLLSQFGVAQRYLIALPPEDADTAVPVLEAALAEGPDFELELTLAADPAAAQPPGSLAVPAG